MRIVARRKPVTEASVRAEGARRLARLAATYSREERETWREQIAEAEAVAGDPAAPAPMLATLAAPRGLTVAEMAARVLALRDQFKTATAAVLAAQAALIATDPIPQDYKAEEHWP